jgi:hypothetical protein
MATNTTYDPQKSSDFEKSKLQFSGQSLYFETATMVTASQDLVLTDDYLLTGGTLLVQGGDMHDQVYLQVVHPTYGVVNEFVTGFRITPDSVKQFDLQLNYPAKLSAGLSLRCKYVASTALGLRDIAVNFFLHKVLV